MDKSQASRERLVVEAFLCRFASIASCLLVSGPSTGTLDHCHHQAVTVFVCSFFQYTRDGCWMVTGRTRTVHEDARERQYKRHQR